MNHMSNMDRVDQIRADIARPPNVYRPLVQQEKAWAAAHPVLSALAWFAIGVAVTLLAVAARRMIEGQ